MTTEAHTRKTLIDEYLRLAGWNLADPLAYLAEVDERVEIVLGKGTAQT